jgi:hypothetical protein
MPEKPAVDPQDLFPFRHFVRALDGFVLPREPFDPAGAWVNTYDLVERSGRSGRVGALRLERQPLAGGRARLIVAHRKVCTGGAVQARAEIECGTDALSTPVAAKSETWATDGKGAVLDDSRLAEVVEFGPEGLVLRRDGRDWRLPATPPLTLDWCLFDAVQRLPPGQPVAGGFSLAGRLNYEVRPDQVLRPMAPALVRVGGHPVWVEKAEPLEAGTVYRSVAAVEGAVEAPLSGFEQDGTGILPTTYWLSEQGRLLFVFSGLFAWVFNAKATV